MYSIRYIDDEPVIRDLPSLLLPKYGDFTLATAQDAESGLWFFQEKKYVSDPLSYQDRGSCK